MNGIDISNWQAGIDVASTAAEFVIVKATGGTGYVSPSFRKQADAVLTAGKLLGVYHFANDDGDHPAKDEAAHFLAHFAPYKGKAVPVLDMEGGALDRGQRWASEWLSTVAEATGATPFFYTGASAANGMDWSAIAQYPLWKASYLTRYAEGGFVDDPTDTWGSGAWGKTTVYQYTSQGRIAGYDGYLDLNVFYGTRSDWKRYAGGAMGQINKFCDAMRWAADSDQVGYSQSDRESLKASDFFKSGEYNTDCSKLVIEALKYAGYDTGSATYTGNMSANLTARGWKRVKPNGKPQKGYILLNDANHVAAWLGDCLAQASIDEHGNIAGGARGDQTHNEVNTRGYYDYPWDCYLVPPEEGLDMDDADMRKLAQYIAQAQAEYMAGDDGKANYDEHGKEGGGKYRNNYNVDRMTLDTLAEVNDKLDKLLAR